MKYFYVTEENSSPKVYGCFMGFNENDRNKTSRCRHRRRCRIYAEIDLIR